MDANRGLFELKWGKPWQPYMRRESAEYRMVRDRIRGLVCTQLSEDEQVLIGDVAHNRRLGVPRPCRTATARSVPKGMITHGDAAATEIAAMKVGAEGLGALSLSSEVCCAPAGEPIGQHS